MQPVARCFKSTWHYVKQVNYAFLILAVLFLALSLGALATAITLEGEWKIIPGIAENGDHITAVNDMIKLDMVGAGHERIDNIETVVNLQEVNKSACTICLSISTLFGILFLLACVGVGFSGLSGHDGAMAKKFVVFFMFLTVTIFFGISWELWNSGTLFDTGSSANMEIDILNETYDGEVNPDQELRRANNQALIGEDTIENISERPMDFAQQQIENNTTIKYNIEADIEVNNSVQLVDHPFQHAAPIIKTFCLFFLFLFCFLSIYQGLKIGLPEHLVYNTLPVMIIMTVTCSIFAIMFGCGEADHVMGFTSEQVVGEITSDVSAGINTEVRATIGAAADQYVPAGYGYAEFASTMRGLGAEVVIPIPGLEVTPVDLDIGEIKSEVRVSIPGMETVMNIFEYGFTFGASFCGAIACIMLMIRLAPILDLHKYARAIAYSVFITFGLAALAIVTFHMGHSDDLSHVFDEDLGNIDLEGTRIDYQGAVANHLENHDFGDIKATIDWDAFQEYNFMEAMGEIDKEYDLSDRMPEGTQLGEVARSNVAEIDQGISGTKVPMSGNGNVEKLQLPIICGVGGFLGLTTAAVGINDGFKFVHNQMNTPNDPDDPEYQPDDSDENDFGPQQERKEDKIRKGVEEDNRIRQHATDNAGSTLINPDQKAINDQNHPTKRRLLLELQRLSEK